jgi:transglutaminase-like putative cysteine protease
MKQIPFLRQAQALQAIALILLLVPIISQLIPATVGGILIALVLRLKQILPQRRLISIALLSAWATNQLLAGVSGWLEATSNLVWLLVSLRLLEANDRKNIGGSGLLLLLALGLAGLQANGLGASLLAVTAALLVLCSLVGVQQGNQKLNFALFGQTLFLLCLALPFAAGLFLLAPRLPALWQISGPGDASTGLSDQLDPGSIASLVQNYEPAALLLTTADLLPPAPARYWRVRVLSDFNGRRWQPGPTPPLEKNQSILNKKAPQQRWINQSPIGKTLPWDGKSNPLNPKQKVNRNGELLRFNDNPYVLIQSNQQPTWITAPPITLESQWPQGSNPQLESLGIQWRKQYKTPEQKLNAAFSWFQTQNFTYTLSPGLMQTKAPLDGVLFQQKRGFCEHYAAGFAALMRAAGIPARVVIGYQGGEWQPSNKQFEILQRDAHAWVELWLPPGRWVTIDPTAWIAPDRIRLGVAGSLNSNDTNKLGRPVVSWFSQLIKPWQQLDRGWSEWIMEFDRAQQNLLLQKWLGPEASYRALQILAGSLCSILIMGIAILWNQKQQQKDDRAKKQLGKLLNYLAKHQLHPNQGETLHAFIKRAYEQEIKLKPELIKFQQAYYRLRFEANCEEKIEQKKLRSAIQHLRIGN